MISSISDGMDGGSLVGHRIGMPSRFSGYMMVILTVIQVIDNDP